MMEKGRVCVVTRGSDAGKTVVIRDVMDKNFVKISGEHVKERRCNIAHLEPTAQVTEKMPAKAAKNVAPKAKQATAKPAAKEKKPAVKGKK